MPQIDRRSFLAGVGLTAATSAVLSSMPGSIERALAVPAAQRTGTIEDVEHVVVLMQENRSFDHYFGPMAGVRGFGDRFPLPVASGKPVWYQSDGEGELTPFHLDTDTTSAMRVKGTPHSWGDAQDAWDEGRFGQWTKFKQFQSMGHYQREDIPFQYALAESFTLCDAHHCAVQTGTLTNRIVFMTGTNVTPGRTEPATDQSQAAIDNGNNNGKLVGPYTWTTYPERLEEAGVSWRIYQDPVENWGGLLAPWQTFAQYQDAEPGSPLHQKAMTHWSLDQLKEHVADASLPQVSWVIPPPVWSEHPSRSSPFQGASYIQQVLDILVSNPEVWSKTAFFITFDENDGFFDHAPPPAVPTINPDGTTRGTTTLESPLGGEYFRQTIDGEEVTRPYGMGPRVPLYVISPWSRGGWVNSEVFDHTSVIQFLERRFGVEEPNITPWHRAVSGDLTSCFDFETPNAKVPDLPDMSAATGDTLVINKPEVTRPDSATAPRRPRGIRHSRALPYAIAMSAEQEPGEAALTLRFVNTGRAGAVLHVYDRLHLDGRPSRYTVEAGKELSDSWDLSADGGAYDLWVLGPGGFFRHFQGTADADAPDRGVVIDVQPDSGELMITLVNDGATPCQVDIGSGPYSSSGPEFIDVDPGQKVERRWRLRRSHGWYDLTFTSGQLPGLRHRFAGRAESGAHGISDPAMGRE